MSVRYGQAFPTGPRPSPGYGVFQVIGRLSRRSSRQDGLAFWPERKGHDRRRATKSPAPHFQRGEGNSRSGGSETRARNTGSSPAPDDPHVNALRQEGSIGQSDAPGSRVRRWRPDQRINLPAPDRDGHPWSKLPDRPAWHKPLRRFRIRSCTRSRPHPATGCSTRCARRSGCRRNRSAACDRRPSRTTAIPSAGRR